MIGTIQNIGGCRIGRLIFQIVDLVKSTNAWAVENVFHVCHDRLTIHFVANPKKAGMNENPKLQSFLLPTHPCSQLSK